MTGQSLLKELREEPHSFSFIQAIRVLEQAVRSGDIVDFRVRPELSVATPGSDVTALVQEGNGERLVLEVGAMGLYGPASPMPGDYNDQLVRLEQGEASATRLLLDVFHQRTFALLASTQRRLHHGLDVAVERDDFARGWQAFAGEPAHASGFRLELASLYRLPYRSAEGLRLLLDAYFADTFHDHGVMGPVEIKQFELCQRVISTEDRLQLGQIKRLGIDSVLGDRIADRSTRVVIRMGPVPPLVFQRLTNEPDVWNGLVDLVHDYAGCAWEYLLEVSIDQADTRTSGEPPALGRLGVSAWLAGDESDLPRRALIALTRTPTVNVP